MPMYFQIWPTHSKIYARADKRSCQWAEGNKARSKNECKGPDRTRLLKTTACIKNLVEGEEFTLKCKSWISCLTEHGTECTMALAEVLLDRVSGAIREAKLHTNITQTSSFDGKQISLWPEGKAALELNSLGYWGPSLFHTSTSAKSHSRIYSSFI